MIAENVIGQNIFERGESIGRNLFYNTTFQWKWILQKLLCAISWQMSRPSQFWKTECAITFDMSSHPKLKAIVVLTFVCKYLLVGVKNVRVEPVLYLISGASCVRWDGQPVTLSSYKWDQLVVGCPSYSRHGDND